MKWKEIAIDYLCEKDSFWRVDAWRHSYEEDANEDGEVIALIDDNTGNVIYLDEDAKEDSCAQNIIQEKVRAIQGERRNPGEITCSNLLFGYEMLHQQDMARVAPLQERLADLRKRREKIQTAIDEVSEQLHEAEAVHLANFPDAIAKPLAEAIAAYAFGGAENCVVQAMGDNSAILQFTEEGGAAYRLRIVMIPILDAILEKDVMNVYFIDRKTGLLNPLPNKVADIAALIKEGKLN